MQAIRRELVALNSAVLEVDTAAQTLHITYEPLMADRIYTDIRER
jgi:hypothetical protein